MKISQIVESVSVGGIGTGSIATAPTQKTGKVIKRENKPTDNALDGNHLFGEASPKGWEGTVKAMKKHKEIDNPWALAHWMKNKGYKSHKKEGVNEISMGDYRRKATMGAASAAMGAAFGSDPARREKDKETARRRNAGLDRLKARDEKFKAAEKAKQDADLVAKLPELKKQYADMQAEYKSLGGSNWQYADRDQNMTDAERKARGMESQLQNLFRTIQYAEKLQKEQGVNEHKKGVRAMKYTTKPRNFVAKNATTGGAGAHKDKKKAAKQGDAKHKHKDKEMTYESKLFAALERKIVK